MEPIFIVATLFILIEGVSYVFYRQLDKLVIFRKLLWPGIFIHEFSHYIACKLMLAPVSEFRVGLRQGHVKHGKSRIPLLGGFIISMAPLFMGTALLIVLTVWFLPFSKEQLLELLELSLCLCGFEWIDQIKQAFLSATFDVTSWQFWVYLFAVINILATFAPSKQDIKNVALILVLYVAVSYFLPYLNFVNELLIYALGFAVVLLVIMTVAVSVLASGKKTVFRH